jgi:hypothetical protein
MMNFVYRSALKYKIFIFLALLGLLSIPSVVLAQTEQLELRLNRDWGYGGLNGEIEGRFSLIASGPENLQEVRFLMDGEVISVDNELPFRYQFETGQFDPGRHTMSALGELADGSEIQSGEIVRMFLSAAEAGDKTSGLVIPILAFVLVIGLGSAVLPLVFGRNKKHVPGQYGMAGGAVCPKCRMPFSRSVLGPNLVVGKLQRCPHCGKFSLVPRASKQALVEAEARLAQEGSPVMAVQETEKEKLERLIDESRFDT